MALPMRVNFFESRLESRGKHAPTLLIARLGQSSARSALALSTEGNIAAEVS